MRLRERLLAELVEERFPAAAVEAERIDFAEPATVRLARAIQTQIAARSWESDAERAARREELHRWPEVPDEVIAAVPPRLDRPRSRIGDRRAGMHPHTLAAVRLADRDRKRAERMAC